MICVIIYDGRAENGNTDDASILEAITPCSRRSLKSALYDWRGHDGVVYRYQCANGSEQLTDEILIGHLREGRRLVNKCFPPAENEVKSSL